MRRYPITLPARALLAFLLTASSGGCYEGWEYYGNGNGQGGGPLPTEEPSIKPIYYILFQPILLNQVAMQDASCFPAQSIREFKSNEWSQRIAAATAGLQAIAEIVVTNPIAVPSSDCQSLNALSIVASNAAPWGTADAPEQDPLDRMSIHLKAPFWEGEPSASTQGTVTAIHWAAWQELRAEGRRADSLVYFTLSNPVNGYFSSWRNATDASARLDGTAINSVDPSPAGIGARENTIKQDTEALIGWVASKG